MHPAFDPYSVSLAPGVTLVEASAGTGKTTALTALVARLVVDPRARTLDDDAGWPDLRRALVVTFTRAATAELVTRIRRTLRDAVVAFGEGADLNEARAAVRPLVERWGQTAEARSLSRARLGAALASGEASVFTIDGFCKRVLERSAFESGEPFSFSVDDSDAEWRARALAETWQARVRAFPPLAAMSVSGGAAWSLERIAASLATATRHPGTRIVPAPEPLADAVARYTEATERLGDAWDERTALAALSQAPLTKAAPADPEALFARVSQFVARRGEAHVDAVRASAAQALADGIHKSRGKAERAAVLSNPAFRACEDVSAAVDRLRLALLADLIPATEASRRRLSAGAGVLTFTDLLDRVHDALHHDRIGPVLGRAIRGQYRVALVDEFQDTDARQDAVFRRAFAGAPLVLVGDPKQAIYAFRGADVFAYLGAREHAGQRFTLRRNYRSAPALVGAVNALFGRGAQPFVHGGIPFADAEAALDGPHLRGVSVSSGSVAPFVWWSTAHLEQGRGGTVTKTVAVPAILDAVVTEARRLLDDPDVQVAETVDGVASWRRLRAADIAVLVRTNDQTARVQNALRRAGLPSVVGKGGDVRASREMQDLEHVLRAIDAPGNLRTVRTALSTELWGWDAARIADLDDAGWADVTARLRRYRAAWQRRGVFQAVIEFMDREEVEAYVLAHADGERRATNLRHALELAHDAEGQGAQSADRLLRWMRTRMSQTANGGTAEMRLESDDHAVQVATVHGCKGLQYRVVFAPFLWESREKDTWFGSNELAPPRPHVTHADGTRGVVYDWGSPDLDHHRALADAEALAEHLRLTYVALTRAQDRAYVAWGPMWGAHASGLGHLLHGHATPHDGDDGAFVTRSRRDAKKALGGTVAALKSWIEAEGLGDRMTVEPLPDEAAPRAPRDASEPEERLGEARRLTADAAGRIRNVARRASFSGWAATERRGDDAPADARLDDETEPTGMAAFASGAQAGRCLHEALETVSFHLTDAYLDAESAPYRALDRTLRLHGLAQGRARIGGRRVHRAPISDVTATVAEMTHRLLTTPLPGLDMRLCDIDADPARRTAEWGFALPLRHVAPAAIADVFFEYGTDRLRAYAPRVSRLTSQQADGLLVGTADLVAECPAEDGAQARIALFDWKSNWLGPTTAHYGADAMSEAMAAHHYLLQSHLYVLGLHRHLQARLGAAYDYDRHVAGIGYVFLRGVQEPDGEAPATGFDIEKPSRALIEALDALLLTPVA